MLMSKMATTPSSSVGGVLEASADEGGVSRPNNLVCFFWVGTAGLGGHLLGTDEENIVLLHYLIYNLATLQAVEEHQFIVRPPSTPLSHNNSHNNNNNNSGNNSDDGNPSKGAVDNTAPIQLNDMCKRDYHLTEERIRSEGQSLEVVLQKVEDILERIATSYEHTSNNINHHNHNNHNNTTSPTTNSDSNSNLSCNNRPLIITDGQLHLRQVVHPKLAFHNITLPETYNTFVDLRKDFRKFYRTDEMTSLQDMANYLDMTVEEGHKNLAYKATATMMQIVARLHGDGHVFREPEQILVSLETGPLLKGEEVDSGCVVRARGLPWMSTDVEIARFFRGLNVAKSGVALCLSPQGRRNGEALIRFLTPEHRDMALRRHKHHMGGRYIEVYKATGEDFISVAGGNNNEATQFLSRGSLIVRMRGLPYDCNPKQVVEFFESGENGVKLHEHEDGVLFVRKADGRATGDAFVLLSTEEDVTKALTKHRDLIGSRYIELFRSTSAEVMNRSMDVRHLEQQAPQPTLPPLIAMPPMMPQQSVAQGPKKDCIRLRGLPFEAGIDHVLEFLGDFAKNIMFRGVHMVYTPQGQPSGEAFIQMTSESAAWTAAHHRHNRFMPCAGKKHRYIEVFQCSGDDMNLVLSGAAPVAGSASSVTSAPPPPAPGSLVPTPGGGAMLSAYGAYPLGPAPTVLSHAMSPTTRLAPYPPTIATPYPMFYWPYPSPPVSPTSGYYSSLPHHTIIPSECIPIHAGGEIALHPGEAVATM